MIRPLLLLLLATSAAQAAPLRVMSINLCTDTLLMDLLPQAQITSVTWLSRDKLNSPDWQQAATLPINHGTAEEVLAQHPDLVLAGTTSTPATRALLARLHIPLLTLPMATTWPQIRANTQTVAAALHAQPQAQALLATMDATLAKLANTPLTPSPTLMDWDGADSDTTTDTLFATIMKAAGATLLQAKAHDLEQILWQNPTFLAHAQSDTATPSLRQRTLASPLLQTLYKGATLAYPDSLTTCGTPHAAFAALTLRPLLLGRRQ